MEDACGQGIIKTNQILLEFCDGVLVIMPWNKLDVGGNVMLQNGTKVHQNNDRTVKKNT